MSVRWLGRYHGVAGEPGGGTPCSHLLNYDPDRALTDYIARLEALQRRLGSVQSGKGVCVCVCCVVLCCVCELCCAVFVCRDVFLCCTVLYCID